MPGSRAASLLTLCQTPGKWERGLRQGGPYHSKAQAVFEDWGRSVQRINSFWGPRCQVKLGAGGRSEEEYFPTAGGWPRFQMLFFTLILVENLGISPPPATAL